MTVNRFRLLLSASILLTVAALVSSFVPPLPDDFLRAEQNQVVDFPFWRGVLAAVILIVTLLASAFACYGLFCLRAWAPRLALWATALAFLSYLPVLDFCVTQFGVTFLLEFLGVCVWGAILAISFSPAYKTRFQTCPPPERR
ncbi:MAG: hypothetical protein LBD06_04005 [Candidatus Accumulibacter sp.]|jgi:hypothetical protein|nr:hypothetical protein [Accumulibacter sp.]